jgi:DNA (cytosine-5)-methyltransferase 1
MIGTIPDQKSTIKAKRRNLKVLSFFSGAMGLDIGLHKVGFETLLTCEIDNASRKTIISNNPGIGLIGDIRSYTTDQILDFAGVKRKEDVDLIAGGPPCQAFSSAGKRMGLADERGNVFLRFIEVIEDIKPKYAVIENVRGLLSATYDIELRREEEDLLPFDLKKMKGATMFYIQNRLRSAGYKLSFNLYNSANYGTPQIRERVIIICSRVNNEVPYLTPTHSETGIMGLPKWRSLRQALADLNDSEAEYINFPEKRLKYFRALKAGQNWRNLSESMQIEAMGKSYFLGGGKTGFFRRLDWEKPSPTLVTHPAMPATDLCHPEEDRPLSVQEYKRIQEFPDTWVIHGSLANKYKQVGNAVPVGVAEAIGRLILELEKGNVPENLRSFKYSRYHKTSDVEFIQDFYKRSRKQWPRSETSQVSLFT